MRATVILFARVPRLGAVKRRLAAGIGDRLAYQFHKKLLFQLIRQLAHEQRFQTVLALTPDRSRLRLPASLRRINQGHGDLGTRMQRAFRQFRRGNVVLAGCDIPDMKMADLLAALRALGSANAVFGPANDGGYWLVGMSPNRPAQPFQNVRWSTKHALVDTKQNFKHRRVTLVRTLSDVDTEQDYHGHSKRSTADKTQHRLFLRAGRLPLV